MEPILIKRNKSELKKQLSFLIRKEFAITYGRYKKFPLYLSILTLLILAFSFFSNTDQFITFKVISLSLITICWLSMILFSLWLLLKWSKRLKWRDSSISSFLSNEAESYLFFDNNRLTFITDTYKSDINWEYYSYYDENKTSIYLFPQKNLYEAVYFSESDIGEDALKKLKAIVKAKLKHVSL